MATERFRQHTHRDGWKETGPWYLLYNARENIDEARAALEMGDELEAEEQMADALNYILFALDNMTEYD